MGTFGNRKLDILGLGETRSPGEGEKVLRNNHKMYYKGREKDTRHGVAIVVNEEISKYVEKAYYVNERIVGIRLNIQKVRQGVIQIYAPQQGRSAEEKDQFYDDLQDVYAYDAMKCTENSDNG